MTNSCLMDSVVRSVERRAADYTRLSDAIWDHPELNFHEDFSAAALQRAAVL
jgi:metal-dependent amidase/aminoacylase/carboxypeptidase family protein